MYHIQGVSTRRIIYFLNNWYNSFPVIPGEWHFFFFIALLWEKIFCNPPAAKKMQHKQNCKNITGTQNPHKKSLQIMECIKNKWVEIAKNF